MQQRLVLTTLLASTALTATAHAAAVVIWPVDPTIGPGQQATALWVENQSKEPVTLQVRSLGWSQSAGEDHYSDQDAVVASPPIATVAGMSRQLIRLIRRAPGAGEQSYRLLIDELPLPLDPSAPASPTAQLSVQMRYSIPLFTYDAASAVASPDLHAKIEQTAAGRYLVISNTGARHARLVNLRARSADRRVTVSAGLVGYVLAGQTMRWPLPQDLASPSAFEVNVNGADQSLAPV